MDLNCKVKRIKDGLEGIIIGIQGNKIRVQSLLNPSIVWRLQNKKNYVTMVDAIIPIKTLIQPFDRNNICTRAQYRKKLESIGIKLDHDQDVLHIISKANGGADHIDNYLFLGNMRLNRRLGKNADEIYCYLSGLEGTKRAVQASLRYGTFADHFTPAHILYERGLERFSALFK